MRKIGGILGRSPFGPTHEHLLKVLDCVNALGPIVAAAAQGDQDAVGRIQKDIHRLEEEADEIKSAIRLQYTTSFFASVSRSELLALVKAQDDVADECDRLAFSFSVRRTVFPAHIVPAAIDLASRVVAMGALLAEVSRTLDQSGAVSEDVAGRVKPLLDDVHSRVAEIDPLYEGLLRGLFERETESTPLDVIFVMQFAERVDRVAKKIENTADVLERLVTGDIK